MPTYQPNVTEKYGYFSFLNVSKFDSQEFTTFNIYVNSSTGSNAGNRGSSPTTAYLSLRYALRDAFTVFRNSQVVINLAGAADHQVDEGLVFTPVDSPDQVSNAATVTNGFNKQAPLVLTAIPTTFATVLGGAIVSQANNADSGMKEITTTGGLTANAFQGKWGKDANNVLFRVISNSTSVINLCYAGVDLTAPLTIYTAGATLAPVDPASTEPTVVIRGGTAPVVFQGIDIEASTGGAVQVGPGQQAYFVGCSIPSLEIGKGENTSLFDPAAVELVACAFANYDLEAGSLIVSNSRCASGASIDAEFNSRLEFSACAFDTCKPISGDGNSTAGFCQGSNLLITGASGDGIIQRGGYLELSTCDVKSSATAGVRVENNAFARLTGVSSSANNGTLGLAVKTGATVQVDSTTDVAGTSGQLEVGSLAVITWANFRVGTAPFGQKDYAQKASVSQDADNDVMPFLPVLSTTTTPLTVTRAMKVILVDATAGAKTVNLPTLASAPGLELFIKKIDSSGNAVTIDGAGAETIDGATTKALTAQYQVLQMVAGPTEWNLTCLS